MKTGLITLLAFAALGATAGDFEVPERHRPIPKCGRDFWRVLYRYGDFASKTSEKWTDRARWVRRDNPEINEMGAFKNAAPYFFGRTPAPTEADGVTVWPSFAKYFPEDQGDREILTANPHPDRPLFVMTTSKRNRRSWTGEAKLDRAEYEAWRKAHPNLVCDGRYAEWDQDLKLAHAAMKEMPEGETKRDLVELIGAEPPKDRYERCRVMKRYFDKRRRTFYDGDIEVFSAHVFSYHLGADYGAKLITVETTNTSGSETDNSEYRWNLSPMFARGAARQFGLQWQWYIAGYMNGWTTDGKWWDNAICVYPASEGAAPVHGWANCWKEYGLSGSALRRVHYYAFLNGANYVDFEEWAAQLLTWDGKKTVLTRRGEQYKEFADFTDSGYERGTTYTPVAICVPVAQGYCTYGGHAWDDEGIAYTEGDHAIDAIMFTLVPGFERAQAMRKGIETNLHNTPYAMMYDVISPDVKSQTKEELLAVMKSYKALVIAGDYPDRKWEAALAEYLMQGGEVYRVGKEQIGTFKGKKINDLKAGKYEYPGVARIFKRLQAKYFPFKVEGDCLYGANRTKDGWLVWIFNNKGVTKFADTTETIDHAYDTEVTITSEQVKLPKGGVKLKVPAADFVLYRTGL